MMNTRLSTCVMISLCLSACGAITTPTATPIQELPTLPPLEEATSTATVFIPALETATIVVLEQTATPQPTNTIQPTATSGMIMEIVSGSEQTAIPQAAACQSPPQNWVAYTVQRSDTLSSLGQRTGVSWQRIQMANCLAGTTIFAGQTLYLPFSLQQLATPPSVISPTPPPPGPGTPKLTITPQFGLPGDTFKFIIENFPPGGDILISIKLNDKIPVAGLRIPADERGNATISHISLPDAQAGIYVVRAVNLPKQASGEFTIGNIPAITVTTQP